MSRFDLSSFPRRPLPRESWPKPVEVSVRGKPVARALARLVDPDAQLAEPLLEDRPLHLALLGGLADAVAEHRLRLDEASLEQLDELVPLPLQRRGDLAQPLLELLAAGVANVRELLGEDDVRLAREDGARTVELAGEALRRLLPSDLHRRVELQRRRL